MHNKFDELTKSLAESVTRRATFKKFGVGLASLALVGLLTLPWLVTRPMFDLVVVVCTITLLPFATSPARLAVLTPTLLEVGLLLLYPVLEAAYHLVISRFAFSPRK